MSTPDEQFYKQACNFGFLDHFDQNDKFDFCAAEEQQLRHSQAMPITNIPSISFTENWINFRNVTKHFLIWLKNIKNVN